MISNSVAGGNRCRRFSCALRDGNSIESRIENSSLAPKIRRGQWWKRLGGPGILRRRKCFAFAKHFLRSGWQLARADRGGVVKTFAQRTRALSRGDRRASHGKLLPKTNTIVTPG